MNTTIVSIGNSKGIRIPKPLLLQSGLGNNVQIVAKAGEIRITAAEPSTKRSETALLSENTLAKDWLRPEEDKAWASLQ
jgi:antitoxin component of MazEF toxin-antitoxin module